MGKGRNHLELLNCTFFCFWVKSCRAESIFGLGCQAGGAGLGRVGDDREGHVASLWQLGRAGLDCLETPNLVCISWGSMFSKALFVSGFRCS